MKRLNLEEAAVNKSILVRNQDVAVNLRSQIGLDEVLSEEAESHAGHSFSASSSALSPERIWKWMN